MELEQKLGPNGEIPSWLVLGYLPLDPDPETWERSLEEDLLSGVGGEAAVRAVGGQEVELDGRSWIWRRADVLALEMPTLRASAACLPLFEEGDGAPEEHAAAYLFCRLVSSEPVTAHLLLGSDDSVRIRWNGEVVHRFVGQRSVLDDEERVVLPLKAGENTLLVRVDNYMGSGGFVGRLVGEDGLPLREVSALLDVPVGTPELPKALLAARPWSRVIREVPPLSAASEEAFFGSRLPRTMALLETGGQTRRPVRILFLGQSITAQGWTRLLVQQLRERYPETPIEARNVAIGGWTMPHLIKTIGHTVLRSRPDLIVFHVYGGSQDQWDRVLTTLRGETCAEILMRSAHPQVYRDETHRRRLDDEEVMLRAMAAKHSCEFVECRREWSVYLEEHGVEVSEFLSDSIHLNRKGQVLMAKLYERHFRNSPAAVRGWADRVRWHGARRPIEEQRQDEVRLRGGWRDTGRWVESGSPEDSLRLAFTGNRVDVMLGPGSGPVRVLIDGQPPSEFNLHHGTFPGQNTHAQITPVLSRYFTGPDAGPEQWILRVTEWSNDRQRFRFELNGSVTGPDGAGESGVDFVSDSGRIRINASDLRPRQRPPAEELGPDPAAMEKAPEEIAMSWKIVSDSRDLIDAQPVSPDFDRDSPPYRWVTVADGLPFGRHELTLVPAGPRPARIVGVEIGRPPLAVEP